MLANVVAGIALFLLTGGVPGSHDLSHDRIVRHAFWTLLTKVRYGFSDYEAAAFIVRKADGGFRAVEWPEANARDCQKWRGAYPVGTIAIAHTHPNWLPYPSRVDLIAARTTRLPVYVITRIGITRTDGNVSEVVVRGDWRPRS